MALIICRECGREISDAAAYCPHCGAPNLNVRPAFAHSPKDRLLTALFALLLGSLGVHFFYLGKITAGIITILLSLCSFGIWSALMFIQGIYMLTISDADFYSKYVNTDRTIPLF